jgi:CheY-like chemotaxis protein
VHRGDEAEVAIAEGSPDLIVLDWMLPGLSGLELCRRLRTGKDSRTIPIILLTARSEESDRIPRADYRRRRLCGQAVLPARAHGAGPRHSETHQP